MSANMNRRKFIGNSAAAVAAFTIIPRHVLGGNGFLAANDRINLGYIGVGKQSIGLLEDIGKCKETTVLAACDVDQKKLGKFKAAAEANNKAKNVSASVDAYKYYRELIQRKDIDAVVIATPDHAVELVRNGTIGEIKEINVHVGEPVKQCSLPEMEPPAELDWNEWVGPSLYRGWNPDLAPKFDDDNWAWWRGYRDFGGGLVTDWGAHMFDIAQWGLDMDESGPVQFLPPSVPSTSGLSMKYENGVVVNHIDWGEHNAVQFIGTEGRIEVSREFLRTFPDKDLAKAELKPTDKRVYFSDNHYQDWIDAMKKRTKPVSDVETGHRTASVCNIVNIAYELQRPLQWNPVTEEFINDDYANMMRTRAFRGKWDFNNY
jgi:predicted dehydrogenase